MVGGVGVGNGGWRIYWMWVGWLRGGVLDKVMASVGLVDWKERGRDRGGNMGQGVGSFGRNVMDWGISELGNVGSLGRN